MTANYSALVNMKNYWDAMRPSHWVKNIFILMPWFFGKKFFSFEDTLSVFLSFLAFSLVASSVYIVNDLIDFDADKYHSHKYNRPIASGRLRHDPAILLAAVLFFIGVMIALLTDYRLVIILFVYYLLNAIYSLYLKKIVIIDVLCIAVFFLIRIAAGTIASGVIFSHWMILAVILIALLLSLTKRRQEIVNLRHDAGSHRIVLPKYTTKGIDQIVIILTMAILIVYALYTIDQRTLMFFRTTRLVYTIPFVCYGIFRYLYLIYHTKTYGDPTDILFQDRKMQVNIFLWFLSCFIIIYFFP